MLTKIGLRRTRALLSHLGQFLYQKLCQLVYVGKLCFGTLWGKSSVDILAFQRSFYGQNDGQMEAVLPRFQNLPVICCVPWLCCCFCVSVVYTETERWGGQRGGERAAVLCNTQDAGKS